jgi:hypothetical protein
MLLPAALDGREPDWLPLLEAPAAVAAAAAAQTVVLLADAACCVACLSCRRTNRPQHGARHS